MTRSQGDHPSQAFDLLATFVEASDAPKRLAWLPTAGTLPRLTQRWEGHTFGVALTSALRSLGQVIFINNPISGLLLLLALLAQTPVMGLFAALGVATANLTAQAIGCDRGARRNGIYGFNGALAGSAVLNTLLLEHLGRWLVRRFGVPPLTLPFCLVTWLMLAVVMALHHPAMDLLAGTIPAARGPGAAVLLLGVVRGFGQVFLSPSLASGLLVLGAVAAGSPLTALIGLGSYNGILTAIALGGTFYATTRGSILMAWSPPRDPALWPLPWHRPSPAQACPC